MVMANTQGGGHYNHESHYRDDRLSKRKSIFILFACAVAGWAITVGIGMLASKLF